MVTLSGSGYSRFLYVTEPPHKRRKSLKGEGEEVSWHQYGTDLIIYDKQNRCLLSDGDYELLLEALTPGSKISHALSSWEYIGPIKEVSLVIETALNSKNS